jgi:hypothetical protein
MSYDISLCGDCLGPIWFPYGDKTHLGTGWDCWKKHHPDEDEDVEVADIIGKFLFTTEPDLLKRLVARAIELYEAEIAIEEDQKSLLLLFLRHQLRVGRSDVLYFFFRYLAQQTIDEHVRAVVRAITLLPEWTQFARTAIRRARWHARHPIQTSSRPNLRRAA